jgi:integrase
VVPRIGDMPIARFTKAVWLEGHPIVPKGRYGGAPAPTALADQNKVGFRELWAGDKHRRFSTAEQLLSFMQRAVDSAIHHDPPYRDGPNPLDWHSLKHDLPDRTRVHKVEHRKSLPYTDTPRFMAAVRSYEDRSVRARGHPTRALWVEFITLTGVRLSEARLATWSEMKGLEGRHPVWEVPPEHHKIGFITDKPHLLPISKPMLKVLAEMARRYPKHKPTDLVFPSPYDGHDPRSRKRGVRPFNEGSANTFIQDALKWDVHITAHGFRSTFTDWADKNYPEALIDLQVGHLPKGKVAQAYRQDPHLEARRLMMEEWGKFCELPPAGAKVEKIAEAGAEIKQFRPKNRRTA